MVYDVLILGGGPAGSVCAYKLSKLGYHCAILEKKPFPQEKTCGGLLPFKTVELLWQIGMSAEELLSKDHAVIRHFRSFHDKEETVFSYRHGKYGIGLRRVFLDSHLVEQAKLAGADVFFGYNVRSIALRNRNVAANGIEGRALVVACGAGGLALAGNGQPKNQSFGISMQVSGETNLDKSSVYFWYDYENPRDYRWAIPIGDMLWNIGVWFQKPHATMAKEFEEAAKQIRVRFFHTWSVERERHGAFCGNVSTQNMLPFPHICIGDAAGTNDDNTGEGIYQAVESALKSTVKVRELLCRKGV